MLRRSETMDQRLTRLTVEHKALYGSYDKQRIEDEWQREHCAVHRLQQILEYRNYDHQFHTVRRDAGTAKLAHIIYLQCQN